MGEGSLPVALLAALLLFGGLFLETRVLVRRRFDGWFLVGLPVPGRLVPIPRPPPMGMGRTPTVVWERTTPNLVRWWGVSGERGVPMGLHGCVILAQARGGVELQVRWAPPWTLLLAPVWLASIGTLRGDGPIAIGLGALVAIAVLAVYGSAAARVAGELRWSFLSRDGV
ncbi:MAG: hypothetical protein H6738_06630 [Alphaproteobacteria bacterium]|nr:hypothetical protein [Alphaproteobacteria bacterium]MCB9696437.1 hypothetical protein [Alphaproteobacteria bacterium]